MKKEPTKQTEKPKQEHDEVMIAAGLGFAIEGDGQEHAEIMREILGYED